MLHIPAAQNDSGAICDAAHGGLCYDLERPKVHVILATATIRTTATSGGQ
jgi:hypothetical protein